MGYCGERAAYSVAARSGLRMRPRARHWPVSDPPAAHERTQSLRLRVRADAGSSEDALDERA